LSTLFHRFCEAESDEQCARVQEELLHGGFSAFRTFVDDFHELLKRYEDADMESVKRLVDKAKRLIPDPGKISPAWQQLWPNFEQIVAYKNMAMQTVPESERDGEWQIVMDNPFVHSQVVCYPGLQFIEAAYLYGYFHPGLEKNEYIRLQKVVTLLYDHGRASVL